MSERLFAVLCVLSVVSLTVGFIFILDSLIETRAVVQTKGKIVNGSPDTETVASSSEPVGFNSLIVGIACLIVGLGFFGSAVFVRRRTLRS